MKDENIKELREEIIEAGDILWEKDLASGLNGNISARVDDKTFLITATKSCLGLLDEDEVLLVDLDGKVIGDGEVSTEISMHLEAYKSFPEINAIVHTHTSYANGYFLRNKYLAPEIFETKVYLGQVEAVEQNTPAVTEIQPVLDALKKNNIVALQKHGLLAIGKELFDCFLLIQALEEAIKVDVVSKVYSCKPNDVIDHNKEDNRTANHESLTTKKFKLFSKEQINEIVRLVNEDSQLQELGKKTSMTMDLAVKLIEENIIFSFKFKDGKIVDVGRDENVEFLITAPEKVWRAVFNRKIDPFVATTQKKMNLRGDFARISKWYAPCSRLFELWAEVPVE